MKRGWTRFWGSVSALLLVGPAIEADAQNASRQSATHHANEFFLAGIRPGRDKIRKAFSANGKPKSGKKGDTEFSWPGDCRAESLNVITDSEGTVQEVRVELQQNQTGLACVPEGRSLWRTGKNLTAGDPSSRVLRLYGEPDSRSPSSKGGQQLELWYYAFDWAGPDVPQVMVVLCTPEADGKPGRVVEITLGASSL